MDELHGDQGTWQFDGEAVHIRYHGKRSQDPLLRRLGRCRVPLAAVTAAEFDPPESGKRWSLRLVLREGVDPYAASGAMLTKRARPFRLTVRASSPLVGEYWADQLSAAARREGEWATDQPEPGRLARQLVPPVPLHIKSSEGTAAFDGNTVRFTWSGSAAARKRGQRTREFPLAGVRRVEWIPTDGWEWDLLRVVTADTAGEPVPDPRRDPSCLRCYPGKEGADALLLAATVTAYVWARDAGPAGIASSAPGGLTPLPVESGAEPRAAELDGMLTRLHREGLLTDAELAAKRAQLRP